jgi:hypothetical protein
LGTVRTLLSALGVVVLVSCVGPPAPDVAICQDILSRICGEPRCSEVNARLSLAPEADCMETLSSRLGCNTTEFAFSAPTRERVLECRLPLMRAGAPGVQDCFSVEQSFDQCPDLVAFLRGGQP